MSPPRKKRGSKAPPPPPEEEGKEGWESLSEGTGEGTIAPSPELEAALEEASVAVDEAKKASTPAQEASTPVQEGGKSSADKATIEALCAELEETRAKLAETDDRFLRLQAEFENFRKRGVREREEALRYGHQNLVKDLLATVDNLERAIDHAAGGDEEGLEGVVQGVELVHRELLSALGKYGVSSIEALAEPFDPNVHEAMGQVPSEASPPNTVVQVLEKGYSVHDRLIRPAKVMISAANRPPENEAGEEGDES